MKAWLLDKFDGVKTSHLTEVPDPTPAEGHVILQMDFAALNPADAYLAEGKYPARPPLPHILGRDGVGTIIAVGSDVKEWRVGQKALILRGEVGVDRWGTLAPKVAVPVESLAALPDDWTLEQAASVSLVYLTAFQALTQWDSPHPNSANVSSTYPSRVVLVTGASGGVGVATVQLAKAMGHTVIGLSRSAEKSQRVRSLGADVVLDPNEPTWPKKVREFLNPNSGENPKSHGRRVDLAIDNIGGTLLPEVIETLGMWGKVSLVGRLAGPVPSFNTATLFFRRLQIGGIAVGTYANAETRAAWYAILELLHRTNARPVIDRVFDFKDVHAAFDHLAKGPMGKVLVKIDH